MDVRRKMGLFERYDFSKTAILKRAGVDPQCPTRDLYHDIAGVVQALVFDCARLGDLEGQDIEACATLQDRIYRSYGWLQSQYFSIEWEELSPDDPDLRIFFQMKTALEDLGRVLHDLLESARKNLSRGERVGNHQSFRDVIDRIGTLMQAYHETKARIDERTRQSRG